MSSIADRIAGAPISWGVCEVPGWGHQLTPERVLGEMRRLGVAATEFGPEGFLPTAASDRSALLGSYGLRAVGGFVPVVLHDAAADPLAEVDRALDGFGEAGTLVLAAATGFDGYDGRPNLDEHAWSRLLGNLDRIDRHAAGRGVRATLHPHVGTVVERRAEVEQVLEGSGIALCLDTGHLLIGGTDPVELARSSATRVAHVHLKDVDAALAARVQGGELTYTAAVRAGIYRPLGTGDVDIAGIVRALEGAGYDGWYVMEQDTVLDAEPPAGDGPYADVAAAVEYLRKVA
ncbi:TIM barrel protein [Actinomadura alba]|uniref:TIM barrel protein n=1 Tax=Actinomadura alba TaxID=406431 RepID=A0ABR7LS21_9ACTN|nr:TIM barrel protein [Actinomadura alba]MBC6467632.1 TIM barrel protein [Actinomadura alba]